MKTIGILETGVTPSALLPRFGRYDAMVARMFGDGFRFRTYDVQGGHLPSDPGACDAYVVTGSSAGVYDPLPWIEPLKGFLRDARGRARLVGVCFGHQVMAEAFGGRVERSPKGWGLGLHRYALHATAAWMEGRDEAPSLPGFAVAASHQDQVIVPPPGAVVLGGSAFTPFGFLAYGTDAVSIQLHPEFEAAYAAALIDLRRPFLEAPEAAAALASLEAPSDSARVARWLRGFVAAD